MIFMLIKYYLNNKYNTYIEWQRIQKKRIRAQMEKTKS